MMHTRVRADENMLGHFWVMVTTRAAGVIPFFPKIHHMPSGRISRDKLGIPEPIQRRRELQCCRQGWEVDQGNPCRGDVLLFSTICRPCNTQGTQIIHAYGSDVIVWPSTWRDHASLARRPTQCWWCWRRHRRECFAS